jgi:hypothetical protein
VKNPSKIVLVQFWKAKGSQKKVKGFSLRSIKTRLKQQSKEKKEKEKKGKQDEKRTI